MYDDVYYLEISVTIIVTAFLEIDSNIIIKVTHSQPLCSALFS